MKKDYNSTKNQTIKEKFVGREVITCMSSIVTYIINTTYNNMENYSNAPFNYDDITNLYVNNSEEIEEIKNRIEDLAELDEDDKNLEEVSSEIKRLEQEKEELEREQEEPKEVYEWWEVSPYMLEKLKEKGEVIIEHMNIWGRTCTGQAILLDNVISKICEDMEILEGQQYSWGNKK